VGALTMARLATRNAEGVPENCEPKEHYSLGSFLVRTFQRPTGRW